MNVFRIHWLTCTFRGSEYNRILPVMLDGAISSPGGRGYDTRITSKLQGLSIYEHPIIPLRDGSNHQSVDISGAGCDLLSPDTLLSMIESAAKITRIDLAIDYDSNLINPNRIYSAYLRGDIVSRANSSTVKMITSPSGNTMYLGSRGNGRLLRIYDMRGVTRVELELRKSWASRVKHNLSEYTQNELQGIYYSVLHDTLRLVDKRSIQGNKEVFERNNWYAALFEGAVYKDAPPSPRAASYDKLFTWCLRYAVPAINKLDYPEREVIRHKISRKADD